MEHGIQDLKDEIDKRAEKKIAFTSDEIYEIIRIVVETEIILQKNLCTLGDIKPRNILKVKLLDKREIYKIADFGQFAY